MADRRKNIPWVEKYRPLDVEHIVMSEENRRILNCIIKTAHFPNLLLYGPPGTGKTTTIINFVKAYQKEHKQQSNDLIIHLNASDDRGIDVIRSQINSFATSSTMFTRGTKIVILDEVDYMTENAQYALRSLLHLSFKQNVRYCLLCNYISRVTDVLQNEFLCMKYDQLPKPEIATFLRNVASSENIHFSDNFLEYLYLTFKSDIRSMVNCMQLHANNGMIDDNSLITPQILHNICTTITDTDVPTATVVSHITDMGATYNIDIVTLFCLLINNFIRNNHATDVFLNAVEQVFQEGITIEPVHMSYVIGKMRIRA